MSDLSDSDSSVDSAEDQYSFSSSEESDSDSMSGSGDDEATEGARCVVAQLAKPKERVPGVVYLSRVPPFMKPHKLKHLLCPYGQVGRVYLQPEDESVRRKRIKFGGNKKRNFTEGWVEFMDKRVAKAVATALNNNPIGGKKRNYYHDDLWNIKYLSKFRWTHLTEKIAYEEAVRQQQMRTEMSQAKRENKHYLASVDKGKEIDAIVERKRKHGATEEEVSDKHPRRFMQRRVDDSSSDEEEEAKPHPPPPTLSNALLKKVIPD